MTSVFSWQNSISLCPASFRTARPNMPVTPGVSFFFFLIFMKFKITWISNILISYISKKEKRK